MDIYIVNATELDRYKERIWKLMTPWRKNRLSAAAGFFLRRGTQAGSMLLRHVLNWQDDDGLIVERWGKPVATKGPQFSLAYAKDYAALIVDDDPIGLDIEPIASFEERTVTMIYRRDEEAWLHEEDPELRFYTLWTRKESITKADGRGHLLAPKTFSLLPLEQQPHDIRGEAWYTKTIQWNGYVISVASRKPIGELNIIELQPESLLPEEEAKPDWGGQEEFYFGD